VGGVEREPTAVTFERLGARVRELRAERGFTQADLAERVPCDKSYLSKIENGNLDHSPSVRTLVDLAGALETDELDLLSLANRVPPAMAAITSSPEARAFFQRASTQITTDEGWRRLNRYLDETQQGDR
jgi:transcriptional regulator with XRE-family HTH domain